MKFRIILGVVFSLLTIAIGLEVYRLSPTGDINRYRQYFIQQKPWSPGHGLQVTFFGVPTLFFDYVKTQVIIDGFFSRPPVFKTLS